MRQLPNVNKAQNWLLRVLVLFALCPIFLLRAEAAQGQRSIKTERLRLAGGDFGYPSPFGYIRGPGMIQTSYLFDTLLWTDSTGKPIPWLATKWERSADGLEWRFSLRRGVKWHDGEPLTADDIAFTFQYMTEGPGRKAPVLHARGLSQIVENVKVEAPDQVIFRLRRPFAPFEESIAEKLFIIPKHIWSDVDDPLKYRSAKALIGSGPYQLKSFDETAGSYLYVANDSYFLGPPVVRRLEFVPAPDQLLALQRREIDAADLLEEATPDQQVRSLARNFQELSGSGDWNLALHFNLAKGFPFNDKRFRQAIAYAVNRRDLIKRLLFGRGEPGSPGGLAPGHPYAAKGLPAYDWNPARAAMLLDEIGIKDLDKDGIRELPDGSRFRPELQTSARFTIKSAELVKEYLRHIGIEVVIKAQDRASADAAAESGNYAMALVGYGGIMADPDFLREHYSSASKSRSFFSAYGYDNPNFDKLAAKQLISVDPNDRRKIVAEMQRIIADDLPIISLYVPYRLTLYNQRVFEDWYYTPGCSPCRGTRNKHMFVTGKKTGF
jgi:peptide/nickel transport system substrate-binding protein